MSEILLPYIPVPLNDGTTFNLPKPSPRDKAKILADLRSARRLKLVENLKATGLSAEQQFAQLESFDDQESYPADRLADYMNTSQGQLDIFAFLVKKAGGEDPDKIIDGFSGDLLSILVPAFGMTFVGRRNPEAGEPGADPTKTTVQKETNPIGNPLAYGNPTA